MMPTKSGPVTIYIVRHGATRMNAESAVSVDRERGWSDVPLTEEGREEARKAAAKLKPLGIEALVSSDLERARETATIIGRALGIKPEFSFKLRPWNLGKLNGRDMKQVIPEIARYARDMPGKVVPEGESFDAFRTRAFDGLAEAVEKHHEHRLVIVAHHRIERLIAAWEKAGQPVWHEIDIPTFLEQGDPPGGIITLRTTLAQLEGGKLSHEQAGYHTGHGPNDSHCSICEYFILAAPPECLRVDNPIRPNDGCKLFERRRGQMKINPSKKSQGKSNAQRASLH